MREHAEGQNALLRATVHGASTTCNGTEMIEFQAKANFDRTTATQQHCDRADEADLLLK